MFWVKETIASTFTLLGYNISDWLSARVLETSIKVRYLPSNVYLLINVLLLYHYFCKMTPVSTKMVINRPLK